MKIKHSLACAAFAAALLPGIAQAEWTGRFPYGVAPLKISIAEPVQIPIPWYGYDEDVSQWGIYNIYGIDIGLESASANIYGLAVTGLAWGSADMDGLDVAIAAIRTNVYGWQVGGGAVAKENCYGWQLGLYTLAREELYGLQTGILNMAGKVRGAQIGLSNSSKDLKGVQIGLINLNFGGPLKFFPIINAGF